MDLMNQRQNHEITNVIDHEDDWPSIVQLIRNINVMQYDVMLPDAMYVKYCQDTICHMK